MSSVFLDSKDKQILEQLELNARQSNALIAKKTGLSKDTVGYLKYHHGFAVRVYTVNYREIMFDCHDVGADGVFTDKVEALSWMGSTKKAEPVSQSVFA